MAVTKTETDFGLENINGKITADGGKTYLQKLADMTSDQINDLILDIENWLGHTLTWADVKDLEEILK